jgi:hypothetical protein
MKTRGPNIRCSSRPSRSGCIGAPGPAASLGLSRSASILRTHFAQLACLSVIFLVSGAPRAAETGDPPKIFNSQPETIPLLAPQEALKGMHLPPGFQATLFAGEPDVQQPIGITTDSRGRLRVA